MNIKTIIVLFILLSLMSCASKENTNKQSLSDPSQPEYHELPHRR